VVAVAGKGPAIHQGFFMAISFWVKRGLLVLFTSFTVIAAAQWLKSQSLEYALWQSLIWAPLSSSLYLAILWRKVQKHKTCAIKYNQQ
jgi:hypothetical protein